MNPFLQTMLLGLLLSPLCPNSSGAAHPVPLPAFSKGSRILFQGDSITDGNRGRSADPNHILGHGYAFIIAAEFGAAFPDHQLTFLNRGVSGNKVPDLAARCPQVLAKELIEPAKSNENQSIIFR
jgi:lysophospholipase L1-like esterase